MRRHAGWLLFTLRVVLGGIWLYAGVLKVADSTESLRAVRSYHFVGEQLVVLFGYGLPYVEIALGVLLLLGLGTRATAWASAGVLVAFIVVIATAWSRGLQIECGCFGDGGYTDTTSYLQDIVRDLVLLALSVVVAAGPASRLAVDARLGGRRALLPAVLALVLVAATAGAGLATEVARHGRGDPAGDRPDGAFGYAIPRGDRSAPVTVTIFEDFMCPFCASLEAHVGPLLTDDVEAGTVRVLYRPLDFLDWASTSNYSARAAGAAACAQDLGGTPAFVAVHAELFARQPDEGSAGLSDDELVDVAAAAGVSRSEARRCIEEDRYAAWVDAGTDQASRAGIDTVPVVLVDGDRVEFTGDEVSEVTLRRVIDEAAAR